MFKPATTQIVRTTPTTTPHTGDAGDAGGATRAVEVAAMLGDSVVHVKHCMDARGGKVTKGTWLLAALSAVSLLGSAAAFKSSISTAGYNAERLHYHVNVRKQPAYSFRPATQSPLVDFAAFGGLGIGLAAAVTALVRARSERKSPYYRVGTAPGVELALATAPAADFPLVAPKGDEFVFNYGAGFDGEMIVNGQTTSLADLAQNGRAHASATTAGAIEIPIPPQARIRARSGNTTFVVSSVAKPAQHAAPLLANIERRTAGYVAASLAVHMGVVLFLGTIPEDQSSIALQLDETEQVAVRLDGTQNEETPPEQTTDDGLDGQDGGNEGSVSMALPEGAAGRPDAQSEQGQMLVKDTRPEKAMSRQEAIDAARTAGFLGSTVINDGISSLAAAQDWSSGFDGANQYGPMFGAGGEGRGNFGMGRFGIGVGGGCMVEPCGTIASAGRYGTIPGGRGAGDEYGIGPGHGPRGRKHVAQVPTGFIGTARATGTMDKEIIRRYIKRKANALGYCYEKQLLANPTLSGTVTAQFMILPNGTVQGSSASGLGEVSSCVAQVISTIKFPAPEDGGVVQVTYPFNFHRAGE